MKYTDIIWSRPIDWTDGIWKGRVSWVEVYVQFTGVCSVQVFSPRRPSPPTGFRDLWKLCIIRLWNSFSTRFSNVEEFYEGWDRPRKCSNVNLRPHTSPSSLIQVLWCDKPKSANSVLVPIDVSNHPPIEMKILSTHVWNFLVLMC